MSKPFGGRLFGASRPVAFRARMGGRRFLLLGCVVAAGGRFVLLVLYHARGHGCISVRSFSKRGISSGRTGVFRAFGLYV